MTTSLAAQLAQIAAKSKITLDIKAQRASHSKSLIFEPRVAAGQSFQTVFTLCHEGFEELCQLDGRFSPFSTTLFSEQSQEEDRTQMNTDENAELDKQIETFLRLSASRLRLLPAIKAIEWLIRRFRIHEFNTTTLITTFLPYHTIPVFVTLMSILPSNVPHEYKFLDPYIRSLTAPPRAAIVHQATNHPEFLSTICSYTLQSCRHQSHYPALISFWGGVMTEAVNGMIDKQKSGRKGLQLDRDQALLRQIGPTLGDALVMENAPGLQIAAYMVTAVYASKSTLNDVALSAFMEQIVRAWTEETVRPGLVCLSILAQHRAAKQLSSKVTKALLRIQNLAQILRDIGKERSVDRLANGLVLALIDRLVKKGALRGLPIIKAILLGGILQDKQMAVAFKALLLAAHKITDEVDGDGHVRKELGSSLVILSQDASDAGKAVRAAIEEVDFNIEELELRLDTTIRPRKLLEAQPEDALMSNGIDEAAPLESLDTAMTRLSVLDRPVSCLSRGSDLLFEELCQVFIRVAADKDELSKFDGAPLLGRAQASSQTFYLSFYIRVWTGPYPALARIAALEMATSRLGQADCSSLDFQALLPYCISAMSDSAKKVRRAASALLSEIEKLHRHSSNEAGKTPCWGSEQLYEERDSLKWLDSEETGCLLGVITPSLEESILDEGRLAAVLQNALENSDKQTARQSEDYKPSRISQSNRLSIMAFLASHAVFTPLLTLKIRLLKPLNRVRGVSSTSRTQLLLPLLQWWTTLSAEQAHDLTSRESLEDEVMDLACVEIVVPNDKGGLDCFLGAFKGPTKTERPSLIRSMFAQMRKLWASMKRETKFVIAQTMLEHAQGQAALAAEGDVVSEEASEFLRTVDLNTDVLLRFLESLQDAAKMATDSPPSKRRRTSASEHSRGANTTVMPQLRSVLSRITFVLQLVEGSTPAKHPELLQYLFVTLSDILILRSLAGSDLGYLQTLVLGSLLAMMPAYRDNKNLKIDTSIGHGDILVNCIQKSSSPAVQNAALLLVASLAKTAPDLVLHSVMPIFTFMGSSVLRQSDDYSAHVVNQTIREVVPPLIDTFRKGKRNVVASAAELLSSFVIAYEHIPSQRKRDLFVSLVENLGPPEFLFAILAMFADKYGTTDSISTFLVDLMNAFAAEVQLQALISIVNLVADVFKPKPNLSAVLLRKKEDGEQDLLKSALKVLTMLPRLLSNRKLRDEMGRLAGNDDMEAAKIRELYAALLEGILTLADTVKAKKMLHTRCGEALASVLNLLSIGEFIKAVETLLDRPNIGLRNKVLRALEVRVDEESRTEPKSRAALLAFLPQLTAVIRDSNDTAYKHTAILCVDKIAEKYGKKDIEAVAAAASTIASGDCLGQPDRRLRIMALLCLASLMDVLGDAIVPVLPTAISKTLSYLKDSLDGLDSDVELHNAAYACISALAEHLPYMISGQYLSLLLSCSNISAEAGLDGESNDSRLRCLELVAKRVDARAMFAALEQNWDAAVNAGHSATSEFLQILGLAIDMHPKSAIAKNIGPLSAILQSSLDLRRLEQARGRTTGASIQRLVEIENKVNEVALKMIYKLNDAAFRPIFSHIMEWSSSKLPGQDRAGRILRLQSVYGFLLAFFGNLKSIVTSYATYLMDSGAAILKETNLKSGDDRELWKRVMQTLVQCFENDQDDFWQAPSHFSAIAPNILQQFQHATVLDVTEHLVPAVVGLAAAADSQEHQKELNGALLKHMRSEDAAVRLAAVTCEQALTDRLGEEWLAMLPEMLPYISELQDDDDEEVDRETHRWIVKIEGVLGESLDSMLQ